MPDIPANTSTTSSISVGGIVTGSVEVKEDHDWYRITLTAGQSITVSLGGVATSEGTLVDPYLNVRSSTGTILAHDDDSGGTRNSKLVFTATTSGTYYIDAGAWDRSSVDPTPLPGDPNYDSTYTGTGTYTLHVSTYTPPPLWSYDQIADQLVTGYWNANGGESPRHFNVTQGGSITVNYSGLTTAERTLAINALAEWSDIIGVTFTSVATGGQIVFHDNEDPADPGPQAYTEDHMSFGTYTSADIFISSSWTNNYGTGLNSYSFQTYLHEIGHALGLGHAGNYNGDADYASDALFKNDAWSTSIMSYFDQTDNSYFSSQGFSDYLVLTPMNADIIAMQRMYGLSTTTRSGDTTYGFNSNSGRDVYNASIMTNVAYTIFDSGGTDTVDYSGFSQSQSINLNPETFSNVGPGIGNVMIARGVIIENAIGGTGSDTLTGNAAANRLVGNSGADILLGNDGDDFLTGGSGLDKLTGGAGNDTFIDNSANLNGDTITDFSSGDKIVFADANPTGFTFSLSGTTLTYSGGYTLNLSTAPVGGLVASAAAGGGVQLALNNVVNAYDPQGKLVSTTLYNADGSRSYISLDVNNNQSWTQQWFNYDAQNRLVSEDIRYDNGSHTFIAIDATNTKSWSQDWLSYDAQGRLTSEDVRNDDGSHTFIALDATNTKSWAQDWSSYDAQGRLTSEDVRNDDGSHTFIAVDTANTNAWTQQWYSYDAQGRLVSDDVRNDDGSHTFISLDYNNSQSWSQAWFNYGPQGQHINQAIVWDDGHVSYVPF